MINTVEFEHKLFEVLHERDVKVGELDVELVHDPDGPIIQIMFAPVDTKYWAAFKQPDGEEWTPENIEMAVKRTAYKIEDQLYPERQVNMLLKAAMELMNGSGNQEAE